MGKKKDKMLTDKEQRRLADEWREFFLNDGNSDIPAFHEKTELDYAEEFAKSVYNAFVGDQSAEEDDPVEENTGHRQTDDEEKSNINPLFEALFGLSAEDANEEDIAEYHQMDMGEPSANSTSDYYSTTESVQVNNLTTNSIDIVQSKNKTIGFVDRERAFCIDTLELSADKLSNYVTDNQIYDAYLFFIVNSRPDAIFTLDEFRERIYNKYGSIDFDTFFFVRDNQFIFAYHVDDFVEETWISICDELRKSEKLYDFLNTFSKKCSSKHYRMRHSSEYITFWLESFVDDDIEESQSAEMIRLDDQKSFLALLDQDPFNDEREDHKLSANFDDYKIIEYWPFYDDYRKKYFGKASSERDITDVGVEVKVSTKEKVTPSSACEKVGIGKSEVTVTTDVPQSLAENEIPDAEEPSLLDETEEEEYAEEEMDYGGDSAQFQLNVTGNESSQEDGLFEVHRRK